MICGKTCSGFRDFLFRGNVVDVAIGIVIGTAFKSLVDALVADLITPLIGAIGSVPDFSAAAFTIRDSTFRYGHFINTILSFVILALVIFFCVVTPMNYALAAAKGKDLSNRDCPFCTTKIPRVATVCKECCHEVPPAAPLSQDELKHADSAFGRLKNKIPSFGSKKEAQSTLQTGANDAAAAAPHGP